MPPFPPEVLSLIFEATKANEPLLDWTAKYVGDIGWLVVTHVCRYWRTTAIKHADLWSHVTTTNPRLFELFVQRSRQQQLSICAELDDSYAYDRLIDYFSLVAEELNRTKTLDICTGDESDTSNAFSGRLIEHFKSSTDIIPMQTISLHFGRIGWPCIFPTEFLDTTPNLCELSLINIFTLPRPITNSNIRYLHLCGHGDKSVVQTLELFRGLGSLEYLYLEKYSDPNRITPHNPSISQAVFPHLKSLTLKGCLFPSIALLGYLQAHPEAYVFVSSEDLVVDPFIQPTFMNFPSSHFTRYPLPNTVSASVSITSNINKRDEEVVCIGAAFLASGETASIHLPSRTLSVTPGLHIETSIERGADWNPGPAYTNDIVTQFVYSALSSSMFRPDAWTTLSLHGSFEWTLSRLSDIFRVAANIQSLSISNFDTQDLRAFLMSLSLPSSVVLLPKLHSITLEGVQLDCPQCREGDLVTGSMEIMLNSRRATGHDIKQVFLRECTGVIQLLHVDMWILRYGFDVDWDGLGGADAEHMHGWSMNSAV